MKRSIYVLIACAYSVLFCAGCGAGKPAGDMSQMTTSVAVETQEIALQPMEQYVSVSSKVSSEQEVSVVPKTSGTVKKLYVSLGDTVKAGDILFEIDDTEARLQVQQAQASLESAQANYDQNVGGSLETQLDQMQATVDSYQIQYDDLKKNWKKQRLFMKSVLLPRARLIT